MTWDTFFLLTNQFHSVGGEMRMIQSPQMMQLMMHYWAPPLTFDENIESGEASHTVSKEAICEKNVDSFNALYPVGKEINNE